jgi:hypothetical protein
LIKNTPPHRMCDHDQHCGGVGQLTSSGVRLYYRRVGWNKGKQVLAILNNITRQSLTNYACRGLAQSYIESMENNGW